MTINSEYVATFTQNNQNAGAECCRILYYWSGVSTEKERGKNSKKDCVIGLSVHMLRG